MHLQVVIAFVLLLWWPDAQAGEPLITSLAGSVLFVWAKPVLAAFLARYLCVATTARMTQSASEGRRALSVYHRMSLLLRFGLLAGIAGDLFWTSWPAWLQSQPWVAFIPGVPQLVTLLPYVTGLVLLWWLLYPVEHASREPNAPIEPRTRRRAVVFNLRHQVLILALPLAMIVVTYAATDRYRAWFVSRTGTPWAPEIVLGATCVVLFILSPILLRRIWATSPLPDGPLRRKLLALCDRIGLRVREILVWHSDGLVVNAAVMGLFPRVRYILLSDTLLDSMTDDEIEAVFGHEAGHVRHHHIQYFLLFALVSMLISSGVMELLVYMSRHGSPAWRLDIETIQAIGFASIIPVWGIAFGWISRRFERQADVYGAMCAGPAIDSNCEMPCAVHGPNGEDNGGVCARGARTFVRALRKVALLNGVPPEERSWRHSSIASRMRFLTAQSGDPIMARRFSRCVRRIKIALVACCAVGLLIAGVYIWHHPGYRKAVTKSIIEPLKRLVQ